MNRDLEVGDVVVLPLGGPKYGMVFYGPDNADNFFNFGLQPFTVTDQWCRLSKNKAVTRDSGEYTWTVLFTGNTCPTPYTPYAKHPNSTMLVRGPVGLEDRQVIIAFVAAEECFRLEDKHLRVKVRGDDR